MRYTLFILLLLSFGGALRTEAQLISSEFGSNRVQHHSFDWMYYESSNFIAYFEKEDEELARFVLTAAEQDYTEIRKTMEHQIRSKIELLVYTDISDYKQTNIGSEQPHTGNTGGVTQLVPNKVFVYFDGNHNHLRRDLRQGIADVLLNRMAFGHSLQEIVQNAVLMDLPIWFTQGLTAYAAEAWNTTQDDLLRDAFLAQDFRYFTDLAKQNPTLAGQSLWHYLAQVHGPATVSNLLYLTRINKSVENGFAYVLGSTPYAVFNGWYNYYAKRYENDAKQRVYPTQGQIQQNTPKKRKYTQARIAPNGKYFVYAQNDEGKIQVYLQEVESKKRQVIFRQGYKNKLQITDFNYPILAWSPNSKRLQIIYERKDKVFALEYRVGSGKKKTHPIKNVERVLGATYIDEEMLVLSAMQGGYSNLYFMENGRVQAITEDYHDALEPEYAVLNGVRGILFSSNRGDAPLVSEKLRTHLPSTNFDLFFYALKGGNNRLLRLTKTPYAQERNPVRVNDSTFAYLSDASGIFNRYIGHIDTVLSHQEQVIVLHTGDTLYMPDSITLKIPTDSIDTLYQRPIYLPKAITYANTNYSRSIREFDVAHTSNKILDVFVRHRTYEFFVREFTPTREVTPLATHYRSLLTGQNKRRTKKTAPKPKTQDNKPLPTATEITLPSIDSLEAEEKALEQSIEKELQRLEEEMRRDTLPAPSTPPKEIEDSSKIDIDNYLFQTEYQSVEKPRIQKPTTPQNPPKRRNDVRESIVVRSNDDGEVQISPPPMLFQEGLEPLSKLLDFESSRIHPYKSQFAFNALTLQIDQSPLFENLNPYYGNAYKFTPITLALQTSLEDVFENHRFEIGVRSSFTFDFWEYFISYENKKRRVDSKFVLYRQNYLQSGVLPPVDTLNNIVSWRTISHFAKAEFSYPFDVYRSLRFSAMLRTSKLAVLSEEVTSQGIPPLTEQRAGGRLEFVFDNTREVGFKSLKGTRNRIYAGLWQGFDVPNNGQIRANINGNTTAELGIDFRNYLTFDNKTILATRVAAATSFGSQRILYSLGGRENWIEQPDTQKINPNIPLPNYQNYSFHTIAANLRGFDNNIRNGNHYILANAELRIALFRYARVPPSGRFFRNFQLVAFADVGTAWQGKSPFVDDNPLNTFIIDRNAPGVVSPVRVKVNYYRDPIVLGYGLGFRSTILGYWVSVDYAWGVETGVVNKPKLYVSLGMDF